MATVKIPLARLARCRANVGHVVYTPLSPDISSLDGFIGLYVRVVVMVDMHEPRGRYDKVVVQYSLSHQLRWRKNIGAFAFSIFSWSALRLCREVLLLDHMLCEWGSFRSEEAFCE
jgi:hypothetical protein